MCVYEEAGINSHGINSRRENENRKWRRMSATGGRGGWIDGFIEVLENANRESEGV